MQHKLFCKKTVLMHLYFPYALVFSNCQTWLAFPKYRQTLFIKGNWSPLPEQPEGPQSRAQPKRNPEHGDTVDSEHYLIHLWICGSLQLKTSSVETVWSSLYAQEYHGIFCKGSLQQNVFQCVFLSLFDQHDPAECVCWMWGNPT